MTNKIRSDSTLKRRFGPFALITGTSDGIGRAFAVQLAEQGFRSIGPFLDQDMASEINMVDLNCRSVVEPS